MVIGGGFALGCGLFLLVEALFFGLRIRGIGTGPEAGLAISSAFLSLGVLGILGGVAAHQKDAKAR